MLAEGQQKKKQTKPSFCKACNAVVLWLEDSSGALNAAGMTRRLPFAVNSETGQSTGVVHRCKAGMEAWKAQLAMQEEKYKQAGRTPTKPCSRCNKPIYWSYERLSKNGKPLPIDEGTDEFHQCPYFTGQQQK
jgi:hypothetical protein